MKKALYLEGIPDRVPFGDLDRPKPEFMGAFLGREVKGPKDIVEFSIKAGFDYLDVNLGYALPVTRSEQKWACEGKGLIANEADMEKYWGRALPVDCDRIKVFSEVLPASMKLIPRIPGIFELVWMTMGFEAFAESLVINEKFVAKMFRRAAEATFALFKTVIQMENVGAMWYTDDIAYNNSLMIGPAYLRKYLFPFMKELGILCRKHGLPLLYHSDGCLLEVIPDIIACGVNGLQPIQYEAMDIRKIKEQYGRKICLMGNIPNDLLIRGTPKEVEELVKYTIKVAAPGGGFCLSSSGAYDGAPLENFVSMVNALFKYGSYG